MTLTLSLACPDELTWAHKAVKDHHYLRGVPDPRARSMTYVLRHGLEPVGVIMVGLPHATRNKGWWGYPGLPTQWQVVDLNRIWLDPRIQKGGAWCQPGIVPGFYDRKGVWHSAAASWAVSQVLDRVQVDRITHWAPVYPDQPYHILLAISYHDPAFHAGIIYQQMGWQPMYTVDNRPVPSKSGKYGWCWPLPEPHWKWDELTIARPRNLRLSL